MKVKLILLGIICHCYVSAQQSDSLKLPFAIASEKKLSDEDLADKKEGLYVTGVPDFSSDPVNGFSYGGEASIFFNGRRSDPFFAYSAYRALLNVSLSNTTRNQREINFATDIPYIFNSKWRLRAETGYEINPNPLYFGNTLSTLKGLSYFPGNDSSKTQVNNASYEEYESTLTGINTYYNTYIQEELVANLSAERSFLDGKLKLLAGCEADWITITAYEGNSLLRNDFRAGRVSGLGKSFVVSPQFGLIYDSRDLETDPGSGLFTELMYETSLKAIGSDYNYLKVFGHFNFYSSLLKKHPKKLVLALRAAIGYTGGSAPFFEYQDQSSSEGSVDGLGGATTLRGYKQSRFLARGMAFHNAELRYRFAKFRMFKQTLGLSAVPFMDNGCVWEKLIELGNLNHYRSNAGLGLRLVWNVNTVLRFDYALSKEDRQFFFSLEHMF